ncbi:MAG: hypothetical protein CBC24_01575 [Candidatus Pelagibacter sp. TMED64]|nr:hypothetical protein [Candidatus Pelagibacter sp.]OUU67260.1 MAG: hypothetical protein CBC24_01575 [Candidatus Pelagibacter sp. TMED64]|tara:strand:- start:213 stop:1130 length:918 start_codon:yes stop_codon:yes gene_type:complete
MLLVVNYHYIREDIPESGIHPITPSFFRNQLELINKNGYEFVSLEDINKTITTKENNLPKKSCLITFDDGLKESYENGLPILETMGIPAAFFVISDTIVYNNLIDVHKLHYLRTQVDTKEIYDIIATECEKLNDDVIMKQYPFDDLISGKVKYLLNFVKPKLIKDIFPKFINKSESDIVKEFYMNDKQIKDLYEKGYLGTHSKSHKPLAELSTENMYADILESILCIEELCGSDSRIESISYPYGEASAVNDKVKYNCERLDLVSGFTMFRGLNKIEDIINNPLMIKRLDTNEVFGGKNEGEYVI